MGIEEMNVEDGLKTHLSNLEEDILSYLQSMLEDLSVSELKAPQRLFDTISPFLIDGGFYSTEEECMQKCRELSVAFGGSGGMTGNALAVEKEDDIPILLAAPVKIKNNSELLNPKQNQFDMPLNLDEPSNIFLQMSSRREDAMGNTMYGSNCSASATTNAGTDRSNFTDPLDIKAIPQTQREMRKQRKANEQLARILRGEAMARAQQEEEMAQARMAAIRASRALGKQYNTGVTIENFSLPHPTGTGELLTDASLTLAPCHRYGLIGKNGAGKSTLLRSIAQYKLPNLQHLRILLVDQHVEGDDATPMEWVLRADVERTSLLEEEAKLTKFLHHNPEEDGPLPIELKGINMELALQEVYDRMEVIGVNSSEKRAKKILTGLGFSERMLTQPTNSLSGGWAMRAALAAALYINPNLLLLDEPTNHLDLHALVWLEHWLTNYFQGIVLVVSHDTMFLDAITTDILEFKSTLVGHSESSLTSYNGDYSNYVAVKEEEKIHQARLRAQYEREREKLTEFISREGKKYDNPQHQAQRKMKMKQLEKMIEIDMIEDETELVLKFPRPYSSFDSNERMIVLQDVSFGWPTTNAAGDSVITEPLFQHVNMTIRHGSRIAIVGKNGSGKTCLLNVISGEMLPTEGSVTRHVGSRIRVLHQHHYQGEQLDPSLSPLEHMRRLPQHESTAVGVFDLGTRQEETAQRAYLANFGIFGSRAMIPVKYLSGGQRMRVALAVAFYTKPDILILDEPTNHLDADTVRALCEALACFEGTIITVSHDEAYINRVIHGIPNATSVASHGGGETGPLAAAEAAMATATAGLNPTGELWVLSHQSIRRHEGSFQDYKKQVLKKLKNMDEVVAASSA